MIFIMDKLLLIWILEHIWSEVKVQIKNLPYKLVRLVLRLSLP